MRRLLTILGLTIIASSVAYADPDRRYDSRYDDYRDRSWFTRDLPYDRYGDRYDRYDRHRGRWVTLTSETSATTDRQMINLRGRGGRFDRIRVEATRGAPVINKVVIEYVGDPSPQAVNLNTRLPRGAGETIRLNGDRRINRIVVYTEPSYRGAYQILGA